ncbi:hypothetical protein AAIG33_04385 [Phytobacter ursingii]|uniref:hypothetical protein n=1 Tax=Phytobacter ursingii TaxID=1972431 RepID=UPI0031B7E15F
MKEHGMIFNAEMVRAIIDGRKTMTRRIMKVQPENSEFGLRQIIDSSVAKEVGMYFWCQADACGVKRRSKPFPCPFGAVGDRIWVREAFQGPLVSEELLEEYRAYPEKFENPEYCEYAADGGPRPEYCDLDDNLRHGWRPSIHMPRWASRITLEITGVRVERLQNISETDAEAEGIDMEALFDAQDCYDCIADHNMTGRPTVTGAFKYLWESIYGEESWQANPWVWVIEFQRVEGGAA